MPNEAMNNLYDKLNGAFNNVFDAIGTMFQKASYESEEMQMLFKSAREILASLETLSLLTTDKELQDIIMNNCYGKANNLGILESSMMANQEDSYTPKL